MKNRYEHDCDKCQLIGNVDEYDIYFCHANDSEVDQSVLARSGNEPHEYLSMPVLSAKNLQLNPLKEAVDMAVELGLISRE